MSGGVDSSMAAALLVEEGYEVTGIYLECYNEPGCRTDQDKADALKVAIKLAIPFQVLDFRREYRERVMEDFYREYRAGRTPNPDVVCNREIKFGLFFEWATQHGYDYVATGHYARIKKQRSDLWLLQRARDAKKDQSYYLWQVPREHLDKVMFPLGDLLKSQVRKMALSRGLPTANKPDSMGICFIGEVPADKLLFDRLGEKPGTVKWKGETVGEHRGLWFYTIGERGKWSVFPEKQGTAMPPLYVVHKDLAKNELWVGERGEMMVNELELSEARVERERKGELFVRIRSLGALYPVTKLVADHAGRRVNLTTSEPITAAAAGQSAVIYVKSGRSGEETVAGGGIIENYSCN